MFFEVKANLYYHHLEVVRRETLCCFVPKRYPIYEVSYAKGGFMHFVPTKKEVYVICTQKFQKRTEKSRLFKNLHVFCTQLQNVETLSLPLNYNITI